MIMHMVMILFQYYKDLENKKYENNMDKWNFWSWKDGCC